MISHIVVKITCNISNRAEQQQERDIAAREAALKHLGIKHADKASLSCPSA